MNNLPIQFIKLAEIFKSHGFNAYLIGGTVRDFLLGHELTDFDIATDATADEVEAMFDDVMSAFKKYGSVRVKFMDVKFDVTTFRKETKYIDHRHPDVIEFCKDIHLDYQRRDFTINAIYLDMDGKIIDFGSGIMDLSGHLIRMIGNPDKRLKEDPLRILRAIRFALVLDFDIEESLEFALMRNAHLISQLNENKIKEELAKMKKAGANLIDIKSMLKKYNVVLPFKLEKTR